VCEGDEVLLGRRRGVQGWWREGEPDGGEEGYAFDVAGGGVGACEDWLENCGEVEGVEGGGEG